MKKLLMMLLLLGSFGFANEIQAQQTNLDSFVNADLKDRVTFILEFSQRFMLSDRATDDLLVLTYETQGDREAFEAGVGQILSGLKVPTPTSKRCSFICFGVPGWPNGLPTTLDYWTAAIACAWLTGGQGRLEVCGV